MTMLSNPALKYEGHVPLSLPDRQWPTRVAKSAPTWLSTDLRDGNQALANPMTVEQKTEFFSCLVSCGFKEIEVSFPAASETDFNFTRQLIELNQIPDDVWIQVMTPARKECILKTFEAIRGAQRVIIQLYTNTADLYREVVLRYSKEELIRLTVEHTHMVRLLADKFFHTYGTHFRLCYGVEGFSQSNVDFVVEVCNLVKSAWDSHGPSLYPVIFNLPSTVECAPANHFADQVEYFCRNISYREKVIVGIHPHNDRGTAIAAAELALLAGADRVDGCLFGNGERSGNLDIVTVALNLYSQGISPGLDFSNLNRLVDITTRLTKIPLHPRHPYAGELVFTAFSGAHQDGVRKGFRAMAERHAQCTEIDNRKLWAVPYLHVDPTDFGLSYRPVRVNSQSGKSGIAHLAEEELDLDLPRPLQISFYEVVQNVCDNMAGELTGSQIASLFRKTYHFIERSGGAERVVLGHFSSHGEVLEGSLQIDGVSLPLKAAISDIPDAAFRIINHAYKLSLSAIHQDTRTSAAGFAVFLHVNNGVTDGAENENGWWGVGRAMDATEATLRAVVSALNVACDVKGFF